MTFGNVGKSVIVYKGYDNIAPVYLGLTDKKGTAITPNIAEVKLVRDTKNQYTTTENGNKTYHNIFDIDMASEKAPEITVDGKLKINLKVDNASKLTKKSYKLKFEVKPKYGPGKYYITVPVSVRGYGVK